VTTGTWFFQQIESAEAREIQTTFLTVAMPIRKYATEAIQNVLRRW
jgi:hypothetical protein